MTTKEHLVEQKILEYESRLKHIDELFSLIREKADNLEDTSEVMVELARIRKDREKLLAHIEELRRQNLEEWQEANIEEAGPMIIWEMVAKKLENLLERIEA